MSLFINYNNPKILGISQKIFDLHFERDPKLKEEMDERRSRLMYEDIIYNISYLLTAIYFSDEKIFENYAIWLYELLCNLMKDLDRDRIKDHMTEHYRITSDLLSDLEGDMLSEEEIQKARRYLDKAIAATEKAVTNVALSEHFLEGKHSEIRKNYINALLNSQTDRAYGIIDQAKNKGIPLIDIYEDILSAVMYEIGSLWHRNIITVDKEHYATSVTQTAMSRFHDEIFSRPRRDLTLVGCAIGSELHEMGSRMLSDIFEYNGWDTYYLGAALPEEAILNAVKEYSLDLLTLSVTMPPYLQECEAIVNSLKEKYPKLKIAVGGQAFDKTQAIWEKWNIDCYAPSIRALVAWTEANIEKNKEKLETY